MALRRRGLFASRESAAYAYLLPEAGVVCGEEAGLTTACCDGRPTEWNSSSVSGSMAASGSKRLRNGWLKKRAASGATRRAAQSTQCYSLNIFCRYVGGLRPRTVDGELVMSRTTFVSIAVIIFLIFLREQYESKQNGHGSSIGDGPNNTGIGHIVVDKAQNKDSRPSFVS